VTEGLITWVQLFSVPVLVFVVNGFVKMTKEMADRRPFIRSMGTFLYGYFMALIFQILILIGSHLAASDWRTIYQSIVLAIINAYVIELAAAKSSDGNLRGPAANKNEVYDGDGPLG